MEIAYRSPLVPQFCLHPVGESQNDRCWQLVQPFEFSVDGTHFIIPAGFWTDFASVPRMFWSLISPYDLGLGPVPHDFGYFTGHANKAYWDLVFLACMEHDGISRFKRNAAYRAVQTFGGWAWERYRRSNNRCRLIQPMGTTNWQIGRWAPRMTIGKAAPILLDSDQLAWLNRVEQLTANGT